MYFIESTFYSGYEEDFSYFKITLGDVIWKVHVHITTKSLT